MVAHHKRIARTNTQTRRTQLLNAKSVLANMPHEETEEEKEEAAVSEMLRSTIRYRVENSPSRASRYLLVSRQR